MKQFYSREARLAVRAIFGESAHFSTASGTYFVHVGDELYSSSTVVGAIRLALVSEAKREGIAPLALLELAATEGVRT
jgi:hypothetical protein